MPGIFYPFKVPFEKKNGTSVSTYDQAVKILDEVAKLHAKGYKQVGITYSANQDQTAAIAKAYGKNQWNTNATAGGANQAVVMLQVEELLKTKKYKHLQQVFRIVPITTMRPNTSATNEEVRDSLTAADNFMNGEGNVLLGWQNQKTQTGKLAIGDGVAVTHGLIIDSQKVMIAKWTEDKMQNAVNPQNLAQYSATATTPNAQISVAPAALTSQPPTIPLPSSQEKGHCTATVETISENGNTPSDTERDDFFKKLDDFLTKRNAQQQDKSKHVTAKDNSATGKIELSGSLEDVKAAISEFSKQNPKTLHVLLNQQGEIICGFKNGEPMTPEQCMEITKHEAELNPAAAIKEKLQDIIPSEEPPQTDQETILNSKPVPH